MDRARGQRKSAGYNTGNEMIPKGHITHLRQECHNSKFGIFELLVQKETFADALLTGIVS